MQDFKVVTNGGQHFFNALGDAKAFAETNNSRYVYDATAPYTSKVAAMRSIDGAEWNR